MTLTVLNVLNSSFPLLLPPFVSLTDFIALFCLMFVFCMSNIISDWLRAGRSGDRIPVEARFSAPIQTVSGAHPASFTMGTGSFPGVKSGRGMTLTPHLLLVPWSRNGRAIPLLPLWDGRPVQSLSACRGKSPNMGRFF